MWDLNATSYGDRHHLLSEEWILYYWTTGKSPNYTVLAFSQTPCHISESSAVILPMLRRYQKLIDYNGFINKVWLGVWQNGTLTHVGYQNRSFHWR